MAVEVENFSFELLGAEKIKGWNAEGSGGLLEFSADFVADDVPDSVGMLLGIEIDNVSPTSWTGMDNIRLQKTIPAPGPVRIAEPFSVLTRASWPIWPAIAATTYITRFGMWDC